MLSCVLFTLFTTRSPQTFVFFNNNNNIFSQEKKTRFSDFFFKFKIYYFIFAYLKHETWWTEVDKCLNEILILIISRVIERNFTSRNPKSSQTNRVTRIYKFGMLLFS